MNIPARKIEELAYAIAIACNGGDWFLSYTDKQRDLWRRRAQVILEGRDWREKDDTDSGHSAG